MRSQLLPLVALSFLVACAGSESDEGTGGEGGVGTTTVGSTTTSSTTGSPTTTTSSTMTTSSSTSSSTASSGGGGEGGSGGMNEGGSPEGYVLETEPNDTFGQANDLPDGEIGFAGELPDGDIDVFAVDAPLGSTMSVVVSDGYGGCPADANMVVEIYDPSDLQIASASSLCPTLNGNNDPDLNSLAQGGTYFIYVTAPAEVAQYAIDITVNPPVCGDTFTQLGEECDDGNLIDGDGCESDCTITPVCGDMSIQTGEECDDGNTNNGDGCDSACQFEGSLCPETEANNSIAQANVGPGCFAWMGQISVVGDVDYFAVDVPVAGSRIEAEVVDTNGMSCPSGFDSQLYLFDAGSNQLAYDDDDGTNACSWIYQGGFDTGASNLAAGTYYLAVHEYSDDGTSAPYQLKVNVIAPGCGDGTVQAGEVCDDGNLANGDGCSSTCTLEAGPCGNAVLNLNEECDDGNTNNGDGCSSACLYEAGVCGESEPNNNLASADVLNTCVDIFTQIVSIGDHDWFQITVPTTGTDLHVHLEGPSSTVCPSGADPHIYLYNSTGTLLGEDDDDGDGLCSLIDPTVDAFAQNLTAGTYYLEVREHNDDEADPPVRVKIQFLP